MEEKRRFVRLDINVNVKWDKDPAAPLRPGSSKNISGGGICLMMADRGLKVGEVLNLEFELPNGKAIKAKGRVVWVERFEIMNRDYGQKFDAGIEFLDISDPDREEIKKFVFLSYSSDK